MVIAALGLLLLAILVIVAVSRRHVGRLTSLATLVAAVMLLLWLSDNGLLPGTDGPLAPKRPATLLDQR